MVCLISLWPRTLVVKSMSSCAPPAQRVRWWNPLTRDIKTTSGANYSKVRTTRLFGLKGCWRAELWTILQKIMMIRTSWTILAASLPGFSGLAAAAASCESLSSLKLDNTTIKKAETVAAGSLPAPPARGKGKAGANPFADLPAFCRVAATIKPTSDSDIKMEIWMPASGWNGNLESNGNGAWTGSISDTTLAAGLKRGYAAAQTDTGHEGGSASFAHGHPEKLTDFGYRAVHELTVKSKAIVAAFY